LEEKSLALSRKWHAFLLLSLPFILSNALFSHPIECEKSVKRIYSHLLISDYLSALEESKVALTLYPNSEVVQNASIEALAESGHLDDAITQWKETSFSDQNHPLLEKIAWSILREGENSSKVPIHLSALISAHRIEDVRVVGMLHHSLHSSNALFRLVAAQLAPRYRDPLLIQDFLNLVTSEKIDFVKLELIKGLGMMQVKEARALLKQMIASSRSTLEEKRIATQAFVNMYEEIGDEELDTLLSSNRSALRHLACHIIAHLDLKAQKERIEVLLSDPAPYVRLGALNALYFLGIEEISETTRSKLIAITQEDGAEVALTAMAHCSFC